MMGCVPLASAASAAAAESAAAAFGQPEPRVPLRIVDGAPADPLTTTRADPAGGRTLALGRSNGDRVACHDRCANAHGQEGFRPPLDGAPGRWTAGEPGLRIVDGKRANPVSHMPSCDRPDDPNAIRRDSAGWDARRAGDRGHPRLPGHPPLIL